MQSAKALIRYWRKCSSRCFVLVCFCIFGVCLNACGYRGDLSLPPEESQINLIAVDSSR